MERSKYFFKRREISTILLLLSKHKFINLQYSKWEEYINTIFKYSLYF